MGNRGILHDDDLHVVRNHASNAWITCRLEFRGWRAEQWQPHHYTVLFFHDEAVALAAGHRPCAECRRASYLEFQGSIAKTTGESALRAKQLDSRLHRERLVSRTRTRRLHDLPWRDVPPFAFVLTDAGPALVLADRLVPWTVQGYGAPLPRPTRGSAAVLTPPTTVVALSGGFQPQVDQSALG